MISLMVLAASLLVASQSVAQPTGNVTFGSQWWNQSVDEAKLQEFRVIPKGGFLESYYLTQSKGNLSAAMWGSNALEEDQRHNLALSKGLKWRLDAEVSGTPHILQHDGPLAPVSGEPGRLRAAGLDPAPDAGVRGRRQQRRNERLHGHAA
ncbi:MAG: hypothetical protein IPJ04_14655 [Candidatus Eisenbacteria bacterium]|nr:hypothetical protein [Candidatus Eisenbacteria bacterium]